jgi:hypothetical protein
VRAAVGRSSEICNGTVYGGRVHMDVCEIAHRCVLVRGAGGGRIGMTEYDPVVGGGVRQARQKAKAIRRGRGVGVGLTIDSYGHGAKDKDFNRNAGRPLGPKTLRPGPAGSLLPIYAVCNCNCSTDQPALYDAAYLVPRTSCSTLCPVRV